MERVERYRQCIRKLLSQQARLEKPNPDVECQLVFDWKTTKLIRI